MRNRFNYMRIFYLIFILFVNNSYSVNFSLSNLTKNLLTIVGIGSSFVNYAGASLEDRVTKLEEDQGDLYYQTNDMESKLNSADGTATAALVLVLSAATIGCLCCIYIPYAMENKKEYINPINKLKTELRQMENTLDGMNKSINAMEMGKNDCNRLSVLSEGEDNNSETSGNKDSESSDVNLLNSTSPSQRIKNADDDNYLSLN